MDRINAPGNYRGRYYYYRVEAKPYLRCAVPADSCIQKDSTIIARGRHLVISIAHCTECHSTANADSLIALAQDPPLSGGVAFKLPVGTIYSANITPDSLNGIGRFTDGEIARVLRYGVHPDGNAVYDFMPFHNISDEDLTAIISYLRAQKPISGRKPENRLNTAGNLVKAFLVKPIGPSEPIAAAVQPDTTAAYGKYLVLIWPIAAAAIPNAV